MAKSKDVITQIRKATRRKFSADEKIRIVLCTSIANLLQYPTIADFAQFLGGEDNAQQLLSQHIYDYTDKQKKAMKRRRQKIMEKRENING